ncbi:MAG: alpha/beta fold hydrolase [Candidatus Limnocylindria bacterium]
MGSAPIVLVPGFWLGAWAWDGVADALRADGHDVTALTLPGLEAADIDRSTIAIADHVDAICAAVKAARTAVVLVVHSGAGASGYGASDRVPERIAAMVYLDTGPTKEPIGGELPAVEWPLPTWEELSADPFNSLEGVSPEQLETFRRRALPEPAGAYREAPELTNDARLDVPSVIICTAMPSQVVRDAVEKGDPFFAGVAELRDVRYIDLPTSHWSMWSRPREVAAIISDVAKAHAT